MGSGVARSQIADRWQTNAPVNLAGVHGGATAYLLSELQRVDGRPMVVVEPDARHAALTAENLSFFSGDTLHTETSTVLQFPAYEMGIYDEAVPDRGAALKRASLLFRLSAQPASFRFIVIPAEALLRRVIPRELFISGVLKIQAGDMISRDALTGLLERNGFHHTPMVETEGTYSIRGALVDVFVPGMDTPVRMDFFGDEVERMDGFDPQTQRRTERIEECWIHPVSQAQRPDTAAEIEAVEIRLRTVCDSVNYPTAQTELLIQDVIAGRTFVGAHSFLPAMATSLDTLFSYFPDATFCLNNPAALKMGWHKAMQQMTADYDRKRAGATPAFSPQMLVCDENTLFAAVTESRCVHIHSLAVAGTPDEGEITPTVNEDGVNEDTTALPDESGYLNPRTLGFGEFRQRLNARATQQGSLDVLDALAEQLKDISSAGYRTVLVSHSRGQSERLVEMLAHRDVAIERIPHIHAIRGEGIFLIEGELANGFLWPAEGICYITEEEIFQKSSLRKRSNSKPKDVFFDITSLKPGDLVVHQEHGVGRYEGLVHQEVRNVGVDFLLITYRGDDKLYLPVYRLGQIQKYQSASERIVGLDKLGGDTFVKTRAAARKRAMLLAAKLLDLYARKELTTRKSVDAVDDLYLAFESAFPFEETTDQLSVISEVMADLESDRPMDRLLCGDVGFGKTEVALRAAFRVVNSGRQVAILVPTTVLAQQHYLVFKKRFSNYPVRVEMLSRFRTKGQNANVVLGIKEGTVDIVVGTHRLLSSDVHFRNLGLLVVDEEHRFGVAHKERIRSLRTSVDTLAMTATPIPRTLHMAFSKLRDLSIISTPPVNRMPIRTMICHDDGDLIREAVQRELARDGQVYFVHNRVKDIDSIASRISRLVPEARVAIGHGQMKEEALERVMRDFIDGRFDVLVSTAIIESGLDIPRANTILIDRADTFGLAQLYQIRGRVGRSDVQAYAYLIVPPMGMLSEEARDRVEALAMHTELGSGFQVASMDLEMRGAGNLLGAEQSGDVDGVGFEMYMSLLEEATATLRGEDYEVSYEPEINLETPGFLPSEYVDDVGLRLHFYKELATSRSEEEVNQIAASLVDRFGSLPDDTERLIDGMVARALCRQLGVLGLETTGRKVTLHLGAQSGIHPNAVMELIREGDGAVRLTRDFKIIAIRDKNSENPTRQAIDILRKLQK